MYETRFPVQECVLVEKVVRRVSIEGQKQPLLTALFVVSIHFNAEMPLLSMADALVFKMLKSTRISELSFRGDMSA